MSIQFSQAVRLRNPSFLSGGKWIADDFLQRRRFTLSPLGVLICVTCMKPQMRQAVITQVANRMNVPVQLVDRLVDGLLDKKLIVTEQNNELKYFERIRNNWSKNDWQQAADYYLATFDYTFLQGDTEGLKTARNRMEEYSVDRYDNERFKIYTDSISKITVPLADEKMLMMAFEEVFTQKENLIDLDVDKFLRVVSFTFGKVREWTPNWPGEPLFQRTSPSGGSRHPTEVYFIILDVNGLSPGYYHFNTKNSELELLEERIKRDELTRLFPHSYAQAPFEVKVIMVLTTVFERNMYRYREPRTFRTVHMDVGHLIGTMEMITNALNIRCYTSYGNDDVEIEKQLGLHGLEEGFQVAISIG
ncbi:SagB/ThcOx family dehydrogenase [Brevibacillus nitrificans]|uniref:SagB/ThcOx family dehydrogenase n=1 Tax=Brevibacillus nitrificans TaxID=651560 RepID=UPI002857A42B|nr:SagB/ThcOx family dehydrogenase [Brevibacillus nitrificans]MDR7313773.1 SagB-type dehydrogenase family enzyme [Brevibacillus nitrificans]